MMKNLPRRSITAFAFLLSGLFHLLLGAAAMLIFSPRDGFLRGSTAAPGELRLISVGLTAQFPPPAPEDAGSPPAEPEDLPPPDETGTVLVKEPAESQKFRDEAPPPLFSGEGGPDRSSGEAEDDRYLNLVRERILAVSFYPRRAFARGREGAVGIGFSLDSSGRLLEVELLDSSPHSSLNRAALTIIERAAPFPAPGREVTGKLIALTIDFRLER